MSEELEQEVSEEQPVAEPDVAPEPAAEEPAEEFNYEPGFFEEQEEAPQQQYQQQYSPEQVAAYNEYMRQQQRQYPQPDPNQNEEILNRLVRNPDGTISEIAGRTAQQMAYQVMQQYMSPVVQQQQRFIESQARYQTNLADTQLKQIYREKFNKDETFASNERVRARVDSAIDGLRRQAINQARMGDPSGFNIFSNPTFPQGVLALAKIMEGHTPTAAEAAAIPHIERAAPAARRPASVELDPDTKSALDRMGISEERYLKSLEEQAKYDDFQG